LKPSPGITLKQDEREPRPFENDGHGGEWQGCDQREYERSDQHRDRRDRGFIPNGDDEQHWREEAGHRRDDNDRAGVPRPDLSRLTHV